MASDDFSATNNPLAAPWASVTGFTQLQSTGGACRRITGEGLMVYSTSSVQHSEVVIGASSSAEDGGPALFSTTGNGYHVSNIDGTNIDIVKYTGGSFSDVSSAAGTYGPGDTVALYFDGNDVVVTKNAAEARRWTDSTHRTNLKPGVFNGNADMEIASWTDGATAGTPLAVFMNQYRLRRT